MPIPSPVQFPGFRKPNENFDAVTSQLRTLPLYVDIDLTNARSFAAGTELALPIVGNSIYCDQEASTGIATLNFQDTVNAGTTPISAKAGFIAKIPFTLLSLENDAQPGKILRIIYGVDIDFSPGVNADVVISGTVTVTNNNGAFVNAQKTVTNASGQLLAANAARRFLLIQNNDATGNIFVVLDGTEATATNGAKLGPGQSLLLDVFSPTGAVFAIGDIASNANIVTVEG